jgi:hypothetical protein
MATKPWHVPLRLATGLYILNSGQSKAGAKGEHAARLQAMAANAFPQVGEMDPERFAALRSTTELALGSALLAVPLVPPLLAGLALLGFAGGLNLLYLRTPGLRQEGSVKPTPEGIGIAKDVWMTAIGAALVLDSVFAPRRHR